MYSISNLKNAMIYNATNYHKHWSTCWLDV